MQRVNVNSADIEYEVQGSGEPVVLIHGSILADAFYSLRAEPCIANNFRVIAYHRRGFAGSSRASAPFTIGQQAADRSALLHSPRYPPSAYRRALLRRGDCAAVGTGCP